MKRFSQEGKLSNEVIESIMSEEKPNQKEKIRIKYEDVRRFIPDSVPYNKTGEYKLIWNGDYYYVVGYSEKHKGIGSFRVDRIVRCPQILDENAVQPPKDFDLNVYLNSMFRMYNGERKQIELVCDNDLMDAIIDKFGKDVEVLANDMKSFRAIVTTATGPVFYSWIFGFGGKVSIKAPGRVKEEYSSMVMRVAASLNEDN